jgi:hypothetical protein
MPLLEWRASLASQAATWVAKCSQTNPWGDAGVGFNLGVGSENVSGVANSWYDQYVNYQYTTVTCSTPPLDPSACGTCAGGFSFCGNYLQMIWASTTSVGCAKASCNQTSGGGSTMWVVCAYSPRGLIANEGPYEATSTTLTGCQYPAVQTDAAGGSSTLKILGGIGAGILMLVGGGAYLYLDGGDGCCCCDGSKRSGGRMYDPDAMDQLNSIEAPMTTTTNAAPAVHMHHHAVMNAVPVARDGAA